MSPLVEKFLGSLIRWALAFVSGWLVQRGIITEADSIVYLGAAAAGGAALLWSLWQKYKSRIKFLTALEAPAGTSEAKVDAMVKSGTGASLKGAGDGLLSILFALALAGSMVAGCGPKLPVDTSPEAKTAVRATQVIAALRATLPALKQATCQPPVVAKCLAPEDTDKVVAHIQTASKVAQELAVVLTAVDDATTAVERTTGMEKARALLNSIQASLTQATVAPGLEGARQQVVLILSTVTTLLFAVSAF